MGLSLSLAVVISMALAQGPAKPTAAQVTEAQVRRLVPAGYVIFATARGDFDGDGKAETAVSIADPAFELDEDERNRMIEKGYRLLPGRVLVLKAGRHGLRRWSDLPLSRETGFAAEAGRQLAAADITGDGRADLFASVWWAMAVGSGGGHDVKLYTYRAGRFVQIWAQDCDRYTRVGYRDAFPALPGQEIVVVQPDYNTAPCGVLLYAYLEGKYRLRRRWETARSYPREPEEGEPEWPRGEQVPPRGEQALRDLGATYVIR